MIRKDDRAEEIKVRVRKSFVYESMFYIQYKESFTTPWKNLKAKRNQFLLSARVPNARDIDVVHFMTHDAASQVASSFRTSYNIAIHNHFLTRP